MSNSLPHIINLPPFMFRGVDYDDLNFLSKIWFILKGKLLGLLINKTKGKLFCFIINFFYSKDGKIYFSEKKYYKETLSGDKYFYPNKRILRVVNDYQKKFQVILDSYCINYIKINTGDILIDCGANVGEINIALREKGINLNYHAFEPDLETFNCLSLNNENQHLFNIGLSNTRDERELFIDNDGGNTSFLDFGSNESIKVKSSTLDSFNFDKKIKLFKVDAEGFEPEVLQGAKKTLDKIEYIAVDFGAERGIEQETTIIEVNSFLYENDFNLYKFSDYRMIGLYKNNKF